jgi:hypothetical protein
VASAGDTAFASGMRAFLNVAASQVAHGHQPATTCPQGTGQHELEFYYIPHGQVSESACLACVTLSTLFVRVLAVLGRLPKRYAIPAASHIRNVHRYSIWVGQHAPSAS